MILLTWGTVIAEVTGICWVVGTWQVYEQLFVHIDWLIDWCVLVVLLCRHRCLSQIEQKVRNPAVENMRGERDIMPSHHQRTLYAIPRSHGPSDSWSDTFTWLKYTYIHIYIHIHTTSKYESVESTFTAWWSSTFCQPLHITNTNVSRYDRPEQKQRRALV